MKLQKVNIKSKEDHATMSGGAHYHVFINNETGEELIERTTAEAHAMQKMPGGSFFNPTKKGYTWQYTFGTFEYDTPDGKLSEGQYAEDVDVAYCRFPGSKEILSVEKSKIVNNTISTKEMNKVKQEHEKLKQTLR